MTRTLLPRSHPIGSPRQPMAKLLSVLVVLLSWAGAKADSVVVFNEIHYHPASGGDPAGEFIELQNQLAVDVDLSGWSLSDGVSFVFPEGTIIPARGYLVVAATPASIPGALGPWSGRLDNGGETVELSNNNGRVMDRITYGTDDDWPVAPDGAGPSLARRTVNLATDEAASWTASRESGGTPGAENFPTTLPALTVPLVGYGDTWTALTTGIAPDAEWKDAGFNDGAWSTGAGAFTLGGVALPGSATTGTVLPAGPTTYYFRRSFPFGGQPSATQLRIRLIADDGAAVYLNGTELARTNLAAGATHDTPASQPRRGDPKVQEFLVPGSALVAGTNVLAVEVHQAPLLASYPQAVLNSAPVAFWRLGESGGAIADLADMTAAPESGAQEGSFGGFAAANLAQAGPRPTNTVNGSALLGFETTNAAPSFQGNNDSGNDVAVFPDSGTMNFSTGRKFSFEAWVNAPGSGQESGAPVITKGYGNGGEQFCCDVTSGKFRFYVWNGGSPNSPTVIQSGVAPNSTWQHVVGVFDQAQGLMRLYVNNSLAGSATPPSTIVNTTHDVSVGARKSTSSSSYDLNLAGLVDEVALFNRALTTTEIAAHFNAAFASSPTGIDTGDAAFGLALDAIETVTPAPLVFNEIAAADTADGALIELANTGSEAVNLGGCVLSRLSSGTRTDHTLGAQSLPPGGLAAFEAAALGFALTDGDRLVLTSATGLTLDGCTVKNTARGRHPDGTGAWCRVTSPTFGAPNVVALHDEIVINEIMFHPPAPPLSPATVGGEWIELRNRSGSLMDLSGWQLDDGVRFTFPAGTMLAAGGYLVVAEDPLSLPGVNALGPWSGSLSHGHDRIVLKDASGNQADVAAYFSGGHWPEYADGGGSSLELLDPRADKTDPQSWAASDETSKAGWQTYTWRGPANPGMTGEPTQWHEIDLCLLDGPGEILIDDVRVTDTTTGQDLIQNGNFSSGLAKWRATGTHRLTAAEAESGGSGNQVLHVVATGAGEYQGNQIESTFLNNTALVTGREYEVSLRARWLAGPGRLNVRLYFNRLARTFDLPVASHGGTPGAANSRSLTNLGPSISGLAHAPVVPAAGQAFMVSANLTDPDQVGPASLKYRVGTGAWQSVAMTASGSRFSALVPGQAASSLIQFYVEATDTLGAVSRFPPGGASSRALCMVDDGQAATGPPHKFRLVMTAADAAFLHADANCLSNAVLGATVIADESQPYYDVGVRLKGSFVGRNVPRVGFHVTFQPDALFRGVHSGIAIDRSQHVNIAQGEILLKHIAAKAGGIPAIYDDLARFVHVISSYDSSCQLRLSGYDDDFLDGSWPHGSDGAMFEYESLRWSTSTSDGTVDGTKLPGAYYVNPDLQDWGADQEAYRWNWLACNLRDVDDYSSALNLGKLFSMTGTAFDTAAKQRLDVDEWLRALAFQTLVGPADAIYTGSNFHNIRFYTRPDDGRALYMPWDWDSAWQRSTSASLTGSGNVAKVVTVTPQNQRQYLFHVYDLVSSTFNTAYMARWTQHYGAVAGEDYSSILSYIGARASYALGQVPVSASWTCAAGTVNPNGSVPLTGTADIRVAWIEVNGLAYTPLWTSNTAWSITVPLALGANTLVVRGLDKNYQPLGGLSSTVNVTNPNAPGWPAIRINEWMAENHGSALDPADGDSDDWLELCNPTANPVDLSNWSLSDTASKPRLAVLAAGTVIPAGGFLLVWADNETAQSTTTTPHVAFKLSQSGETVALYAPDGRKIDSITFAAQAADVSEGRYPNAADGIVVLSAPTPGGANVRLDLAGASVIGGFFQLEFTTTPGHRYRVECSSDLGHWVPLTSDTTATSDGLMVTDPLAPGPRFYRPLLLAP